jgi:hypothetical protein
MMRSPHLLLAGNNPQKVMLNIRPLISGRSAKSLEDELKRNVRGLFRLGEEHFRFAKGVAPVDWRQRISRAYYGAYNVARAVRLDYDGSYSRDSSDHQKIDQLPAGFPNLATYTNNLRLLRDDRNLCDYDHTALESELVRTPADTLRLVEDFLRDARAYFRGRGIRV